MSTTARRLILLVPAGIALLAGLDAALLHLGLPAADPSPRLPEVHGMLLVLGFVGTVVALERAVALHRRFGYAAPALLGLGGLLLISPAPLAAGRIALLAGSLALAGLYVPLWHRQRDESVLVQALGAVMAVGGALLYAADVPVPRLLPWLAVFVILTIAGERLELARVQLLSSKAVGSFLTCSVAVVMATTTTLLWPVPGYPALGASLLALVGWLLRHDVARRTMRARGLPRFIAWCLLLGYAWLAVAAMLLLLGPALEGPRYDAVVHATFLGFTMSMIMAHAPVILPAVLRVRLPYHPMMIGPVLVLHGSLFLRVAVGDVLGLPVVLQVGGALNVAALLSFVLVTIWCLHLGRHRPASGESAAGPGAARSTAPAPTARS